MTCFAPVRGRTLRATRLDACGNPAFGPDSVSVTNGFVTVEFTAEQNEIEAIQTQNAWGDYCVDVPAQTKTNGYTVNVTFCDVNPELYSLLSGQPVVLDENDDPIGMDVEFDRDPGHVALELWTGIASNDACAPGVTSRHGFLVLPFLQGGALGDFTVENGALTFQITGARTLKGAQWGAGPYDVQSVGGVPSPLSPPLTDKNVLRIISTTVEPPVADCDATALGVPATDITAGTPATLEPVNSYAPLNLAELTLSAPTADPATAWAANEYVILRDGSRATWDGTTWVAA